MTINLDELERLAREATPGPWEWHTGCSWRRLSTVDGERTGDVLCPEVARDGHPDCSIKTENMAYIAACSPDVMLELVEEVRRLKAEHAENARVLGFLVSELRGRVVGGKLRAVEICWRRAQEAAK